MVILLGTYSLLSYYSSISGMLSPIISGKIYPLNSSEFFGYCVLEKHKMYWKMYWNVLEFHVSDTRFFFYKNIVYKNIEAEIWFTIFDYLEKYSS